MKAEARIEDDPKHGETLVVTYYVRRRQLQSQGLKYIVMFISKDIVRRILGWKDKP